MMLFSCFRLSAAEYYWVGGTGNWSDISHWATSSGGGTMFFTAPSATDNVHFDAGSFTAPGQVVSINTTAICRDVNWTGALFNPAFTCSAVFSLRIYGSLTLIPNMTFTFNGPVYFEATTTGKTITSAGKTFGNNVYLRGNGGGWTLTDNINVTVNLNYETGTFNTNGKSVTCGGTFGSSTTTRNLNISNSTITVVKWEMDGLGLTINTNNSLIKASGSFIHSNTPTSYNNVVTIILQGGGSNFNLINGMPGLTASGIVNADSVVSTSDMDLKADYVNYIRAKGKTDLGSGIKYKKVVLDSSATLGSIGSMDFLSVGGEVTVNSSQQIRNAVFGGNGNLYSSSTFDTLLLTAGKIYILEKGTIQTINKKITLNGRCSGYLVIRSSQAGTNAGISKSTGSVTGNYLLLKDVSGIGGASFVANNSIDMGNNPGWTINTSSPTDLYWIGGTGNWSDSSHWSTTSGGTGGACLPNPFVNVHFDANSFSAAGQTVTMDAQLGNCRDMIWTGAGNKPGFSGSSLNSLHIYSSLTLITSMINNFSGNVYFNSADTGKTITTGYQGFKGDVYFEGSGGAWKLLDSFKVAKDIYLNEGSLNTNGNFVRCSFFNSKDSLQRGLNIANSTINALKWELNGSKLAFNSANSLIDNITDFKHTNAPKKYNNLRSSNATVDIKGGRSNYNLITITSGTLNLFDDNIIDSLLVSGILYVTNSDSINYLYVKVYGRLGDFSSSYQNIIQKAVFDSIGYVYGSNYIKYLRIDNYGLIQGNNTFGNAFLLDDAILNGDNTYDTLNLFPGKTYTLQVNNTQTVNKQLNLNGRCSAYLTLESSDVGTNAIVSKPSGSVLGNYLIIRDIKGTGGSTFTANSSIGIGNNPGWVINSLSASDMYWVGGNGKWSDSTHWAFSSGGTGSACIPGPYDNVHFDSNSFTATKQTVTLDISYANCNNMDWTGAKFIPTFDVTSNKNLHIFGSLTLIPAMKYQFYGFAYFEAVSSGKTIRSAGQKFYADIHFIGQGGEWTMLDSLWVGSSVNLINGTLKTNSKKLICNSFNSFVTTKRNLDISNSVISVKTWGVFGTNLKLNSKNSLINNINSFTHFFDSNTYNNILCPSSVLSFKGGDCKFNVVTVSAGAIQMQGNNTIDSLVVNGGLNMYDNNKINYLYSKGEAFIGNATDRQIIQKAVIDSSAIIYGDNRFGYLNIAKIAFIEGTDTMGKVLLRGDAIIDGNNIYDSLLLFPGNTYQLQDGKTQTIKNQLLISGNNCFPTAIRSRSAGSLSNISKASGKVSADFLELRDIKATGGASFFAGSHSSNLGNNPGWNFSTSPDYIYGLGKDTTLCFGDLLRTSNFNGAKTFVWQDSSTKPFFKITKPGAYWVKASFGLGCTYADTIVVKKVKPRPQSGFLVNDTLQCLTANKFIFTDTSTIDSGSITGFKWYFGDGNSDSIQNPVHVYGVPDTFNMMMVSTSSLGCKDTIGKSMYVYDPPVVGFTVNNSRQCLSGNKFIFTDKTTNPQPGSASYHWNFGDGSTDTIRNPVHSFAKSDTFTVWFVVKTKSGCDDSFSMPVYVFPSGIVSFSVNDSMQCLSNNKFVFKDDIKSDTLWSWDLGDGNTSITDSFTHSYTLSDTFRVKLRVTTAAGCRDSVTKTVIVQPSPKAGFTAVDTSQCLKGNNFSFLPVYSNKNIKSISWDFGDTSTSAVDSPLHSYAFAGTYIVKSVFLSAFGCSDSITKQVYVQPMPEALFAIYDSSQCFEKNDFGFVNKSTITSGNMTYIWNFGDTQTSVLVNPHHQYAYADTFTVLLKVVSQEGCADSFSKHTFLHVHPEPVADYVINDTTQCLVGNAFSFANNSSLKSGTFKQNRDFNDGSISDSFNTSHSYTTFDTFTTKLLITSDWGCKDSILKKVYVSPMPKADFTVNTNPQPLAGNNFVFTNQSNIPWGNMSYTWDYGDGSPPDNAVNGNHSYSKPDTFEVKLISVSDGGCPDSFSMFVYVQINVSVDFTAKRFCLGDTVIFESFCNAAPDSFINYLWDYGDGNQAIVWSDPRHAYADTGTYTVNLVGNTYLGYKGSISKTIKILPKPALSITYNKDTAFYPGGSTILTANGIFDSILWSTGQTTADITVKNAGIYSVRVTDVNGCAATESIQIYLLEKKSFASMNVITPNDDGFNDVWKVGDIDQYKPCKVKIFNRWGDELYSSDDYQNDWNGTYKGKKLPEGTYYYYFETKDGVSYKGAINILK
jgi:gliding motility-associated-like protein